MTARDRILARVRAFREQAGMAANAEGGVSRRLSAPAPVGPTPRMDRQERMERFIAKAEAVQCTVTRLPVPGALPRAIAAALRNRNLPASIRVGADPAFAGLNWEALEVSVGAGRLAEPATLSRASFGVAETGSLAFLSGPENPVTLTFLGDHHFAMLREADVVCNFEEVWCRIRAEGRDPRTVNFVTGPSRSADIEQSLQLGAHGPVSQQIFLIGPDA